MTLCFAVVAGGLFADFKSFSAVLRGRKELIGAYQPGATIGALARDGKQQVVAEAGVLHPVARDATPGPRLAAAGKPVLFVLFVGETLRAQNFDLNCYGRDTTPGLVLREVIDFPQITAGGISTAASLPCMVPGLSQKAYTREKFLTQENLLDVLARSGLALRWGNNNTGDRQIDTRPGRERVDTALDSAACAGECADEAFLPLIRNMLDEIATDTVLALHRIGNHGPACHLRYPAARVAFQPDCRTAQFSDCTVEQIVNSYDNAVQETDFVLPRTNDLLAATERVLPAMLHLSGHGESRGGNGLYLHAASRFMAPAEQTQMPMVLWPGAGFRDAMALDQACLRKAPASHDILFHSVPGLMDVTATACNPVLDVTAGCGGLDPARAQTVRGSGDSVIKR